MGDYTRKDCASDMPDMSLRQNHRSPFRSPLGIEGLSGLEVITLRDLEPQ